MGIPPPAPRALVAVPWHVWWWFALGSFVPDTLWFKAGEDSWEGHTLRSGVGLYWRLFPAATALVVATVVFGVAGAAVGRQRVAVVAVAAGLAHFAAVSALGTPPYAWYFAPLVTGCALVAAVTAAQTRPAVLATVGLTLASVGFLASRWRRPWRSARWSISATAVSYTKPSPTRRSGRQQSTTATPRPARSLAG